MPSTLTAASNGICPAALGSSSLDYIHFTEEENRGSEQLSDRVPGHMPHTAHSLLHGRGGIWRSSIGKESACNLEDLGLIPGLGRSPGEGKGYPLQYSGLKNPMDYSPWGRKELDTTEQLAFYFISKSAEGCLSHPHPSCELKGHAHSGDDGKAND